MIFAGIGVSTWLDARRWSFEGPGQLNKAEALEPQHARLRHWSPRQAIRNKLLPWAFLLPRAERIG